MADSIVGTLTRWMVFNNEHGGCLLQCIKDEVIKTKRKFQKISLMIISNQSTIGSVTFPSCPSVGRSVGWSVRHNFRNGRKVTLPCSYRSTIFSMVLNGKHMLCYAWDLLSPFCTTNKRRLKIGGDICTLGKVPEKYMLKNLKFNFFGGIYSHYWDKKIGKQLPKDMLRILKETLSQHKGSTEP